jgi:hypothetical protein
LSAPAFTLILAIGAPVLALWIIVRYSGFGPQKLVPAVVHALVAVALLQLLLPVGLDAVDASSLPAAAYVKVFGVALPLLVYTFLSGGWTTRAALGLLR